MIYPSADKLELWGSKYSLVVLAAKRAKQIKSGAPPLIETSSRNPLTIALEEIAAGKIHCQVADHDILPKTTQEAEVAQLLAIPTLPLEDEDVASADAETASIFSAEVELVSDEDEHDEEEVEAESIVEEEDSVHEPVFREEDDEEAVHFEDEADVDAEPAAIIEELVEDTPKPKTRGRKKKVDPAPDSEEEPVSIDLGEDDS